ncbi:pyrrolysine biosynthesis protein PylD [Desulfitobacterium dehalogenans ATCC 51507]|uniref:Pyrrolysine biosynthesis protein PylD n=1 Tax=Desulfitobacterium dehalogenans (strain ATCC 51507 / DSM 9161 / JW/IU-DC1) TaxID=756499 RepID=I4A4Z5_DESDJ|nr:3-methylornithyl-N6-L-lysine dehydrogenase PylD [Desulfitobacterium dehalogenans]AFL99029.1 pyrrolysine biosynthesis protein PylD [Desulfitobacterium dehalogenans ATCC 51507]
MTRLSESDIRCIGNRMENYNRELVIKTGHTLSEIAAHAVGISQVNEGQIDNLGNIAVVPITSGLGVIRGFAETVSGILTFLGAKAQVMNHSDVQGVAEALERKSEMIFMADDDRFIAMHLKSGYFSENSEATGKGYAAALDYMVNSLENRSVLIMGAGRVGRAAAFSVLNFKGKVHVFDLERKASETLAQEIYKKSGSRISIEENLIIALRGHQFIIDACSEGEFINKEHITPESYIAAPGVPLGIHPEAIPGIKPRLIHDPLQLGVATMLFDMIKVSGIYS